MKDKLIENGVNQIINENTSPKTLYNIFKKRKFSRNKINQINDSILAWNNDLGWTMFVKPSGGNKYFKLYLEGIYGTERGMNNSIVRKRYTLNDIQKNNDLNIPKNNTKINLKKLALIWIYDYWQVMDESMTTFMKNYVIPQKGNIGSIKWFNQYKQSIFNTYSRFVPKITFPVYYNKLSKNKINALPKILPNDVIRKILANPAARAGFI